MLILPGKLTNPGPVLSWVADAIIAILAYPLSLGAITFFAGTTFVLFKSLMILRRRSVVSSSVEFFLSHLEYIFYAILAHLAIFAYKISRSLADFSLAIYRHHHPEHHAEKQFNDFSGVVPTSPLAFNHVHDIPLQDVQPADPVSAGISPLIGIFASPQAPGSPSLLLRPLSHDIQLPHQQIVSETPGFSWLPSRLLSNRRRYIIDLPDVSKEIPLLPSRLFRFLVDLLRDKPCDAMEVTIAAGDFCDEEDEDVGKMHNLKAYIDEELQGRRGIQVEKASLQLQECSHQGCRQLENGHSLIAHALKGLQKAGLLGKLQELHLKFPNHHDNNGQSLLRSSSQADITELEHFYWEGDLRAFPEPWCSISSMPFYTLVTVSLLQCKISLDDCLAILYEAAHCIETLEVNQVEDVSSSMIPVSRSTLIKCSKLKTLTVTSAVGLEPFLQRLDLASSVEKIILDLRNETTRRSLVACLRHIPWESPKFSSFTIKSPLLPDEREAIVFKGGNNNKLVICSE